MKSSPKLGEIASACPEQSPSHPRAQAPPGVGTVGLSLVLGGVRYEQVRGRTVPFLGCWGECVGGQRTLASGPREGSGDVSPQPSLRPSLRASDCAAGPSCPVVSPSRCSAMCADAAHDTKVDMFGTTAEAAYMFFAVQDGGRECWCGNDFDGLKVDGSGAANRTSGTYRRSRQVVLGTDKCALCHAPSSEGEASFRCGRSRDPVDNGLPECSNAPRVNAVYAVEPRIGVLALDARVQHAQLAANAAQEAQRVQDRLTEVAQRVENVTATIDAVAQEGGGEGSSALEKLQAQDAALAMLRGRMFTAKRDLHNIQARSRKATEAAKRAIAAAAASDPYWEGSARGSLGNHTTFFYVAPFVEQYPHLWTQFRTISGSQILSKTRGKCAILSHTIASPPASAGRSPRGHAGGGPRLARPRGAADCRRERELRQ